MLLEQASKQNLFGFSKGIENMNTTVLHRTTGARLLTARLWAAFSAFIMMIAELDARQGKSEPFGL
jgi:hypothetical protein